MARLSRASIPIQKSPRFSVKPTRPWRMGSQWSWLHDSCAKKPLPERVATTDLFHDVAKLAEKSGQSFYMLGASPTENARAVDAVRALYPKLKILGNCHGYLNGHELNAKLEEINTLAPDILWLAMVYRANRYSSGTMQKNCLTSALSRHPADCSTSCREKTPAPRNGCSKSAWNGHSFDKRAEAPCMALSDDQSQSPFFDPDAFEIAAASASCRA